MPRPAKNQPITASMIPEIANVPGNPNQITLLCTSRGHNSFKRFTLDGRYISTLFLPGAFVCRPVIKGKTLYSGVCWSRLRYLEQTPNSGFVTILNEKDQVISNPGGSAPEYRDGQLQLMVQATPVFKHCHDVCVDQDENLYICQWNAGQIYPVKLERVWSVISRVWKERNTNDC